MARPEETRLDVRVVKKSTEAADICSFELAEPAGRPLPAFTAGSHIDVHLRDGITRQYSLCSPPWERDRYRIAVLREPQSRGGSTAMHDTVREGDMLRISHPRNLFPLDPSASQSLLFAGGIGITPLLSMAEVLKSDGRRFMLHYCARSPERAAFADHLQRRFDGSVAFHFDSGPPEQRLDIATILGQAQPDMHHYICGPSGFIEWIVGAAKSAGWDDSRLHREYFKATKDLHAESERPFRIRIASTGTILHVASGQSAIEVLANHGIDVPTSCEQGICGTCLTRVIAGEPDHRDMFLTERERARNDCFTPCCSRARSDTLVLDL